MSMPSHEQSNSASLSTTNPSQPETSRYRGQTLSIRPTRGHTGSLDTADRQYIRGCSAATIGSDAPNATESDSPDVNGETPIGTPRSRNLNRLIQKALQTCKGNGNVKSFLPDDKLADIMTGENVQYYLSNSGNASLRKNHTSIIKHVCGETARSNTRRASRRIFSILLLMKEPHLILDFIDQGIDDGDLPLSLISSDSSSSASESGVDDDEGNFLARKTSDGPISINFGQWSYAQRETFYNNQWRVQIPIFLRGRRIPDVHPIHKFHSDIILPWIEYEEHYNGLSDVSRVRIHREHSQLGGDEDRSFALKSLKPIKPQYGEQEFRLEVKALLKVKARKHLEVGLLTSFEYRERFHLLFRWAEGGNLRDLWTKHHARPEVNYSWISWMAKQFYGLAHGLDGIHNTKMTVSEVDQISPISPTLAQQLVDSGQSSLPEDEGKDYGRHGDIKPENVLWFKQDTRNHDLGILKLSDFGLTTFHRALTTGVKAEDVRVTNTYSAPEREIEETLSRPFDVWSLGCIFLEFVTWILLGSKGITAFGDSRFQDGGDRNPRFSLDNFFTVLRDEEAKYQAKVKPSVSKWIIGLKKRRECSQFLSELLDYIQNKMLQVRKEDRDTSKTVSDQLKAMMEKCKDEGYALQGRRNEFQQKNIATKSRSEESEKGEHEAGSKRAKRKRSEIQSGYDSNDGPASRTRSRRE